VGLLLTAYRCPPIGLPGPLKAMRLPGAAERASASRCRGSNGLLGRVPPARHQCSHASGSFLSERWIYERKS
jgi:hypothetical protein